MMDDYFLNIGLLLTAKTLRLYFVLKTVMGAENVAQLVEGWLRMCEGLDSIPSTINWVWYCISIAPTLRDVVRRIRSSKSPLTI